MKKQKSSGGASVQTGLSEKSGFKTESCGPGYTKTGKPKAEKGGRKSGMK